MKIILFAIILYFICLGILSIIFKLLGTPVKQTLSIGIQAFIFVCLGIIISFAQTWLEVLFR